jgi:hypothetical protein
VKPLRSTLLALSGLLAFSGLVGCSSSDQSSPAPVTITLPPAPEASVSVSGDYAVQVGATLQLTAATENGTDSSYSWQTTDETVATVDANGVVTGVLAGETTIIATGIDSGKAGQHGIVVLETQKPAAPIVTVSGDVVVQVHGTGFLTASTQNGTDASYAWASSDAAIASVDQTGTVTGLTPGQVTISATGSDSQAVGTRDIVVALGIPNYDNWASSAHGDYGAEAFNHWNSADPAEVPTSCAKCHSTPGFQDYIGADGTTAFAVDQPAPIGTAIECAACHNDTADALSSVIFPGGANPGVRIDNLDSASARCMTCHQGRESTASVDEAIAAAGVASDDEVSANLGFKNVHYLAAGATLEAGRVSVGYEYAGQSYDWRFRHVPGKDTCTGCHNPHSLEVKVAECATCHNGVQSVDDLKNIRMASSKATDYDGNGSLTQGVYYEIQGLQDKLLTAIQALPAVEQPAGPAICYDGATYPYWFIDTNANGVCDGTENTFANGYNAWTARLVRATYNYQVSVKDPGAYAHNAKYIIQLLFDSVQDIDSVTSQALLASAARNDPGHFDGAGEPARHWDSGGMVDASCAKCHSGADGYRFFLQNAVSIPVPEPGNGMQCATCHDNAATEAPNGGNLVSVPNIVFPGGATADLVGVSNMCGTCHSGRVSKADIDAQIATGTYKFLNVHYLPAAAVKAGTLAKVGYEYPGKTYNAFNVNETHPASTPCTFCHDPTLSQHTFDVQSTFAAGGCACHVGASNAHGIRQDFTDYDGNGNTSEPMADEVGGVANGLIATMRAVTGAVNKPICYDPVTYPYFFKDNHSQASGRCLAADTTNANKYPNSSWTPALMKAAQNFQISQKEPGAWAHNKKYILELLIDSMEDLAPGSSTAAGFIRPAP